ncbi:probable tubulin polyglutamylase TTLL2 [Amphibalanus amphitrite]|uniref:probable tubulin polyglutamylase TTLL2 n=1 Tax=Amphibalanus amphitrite TaxID=1232801 RepID=UPI001C9087E0|nr:probable tubulin polyglutamylase TTLL2 [Amphibalanus amphitrite]
MRREGPFVGERPDAASPSNRGPMILTGPIAGDRPVVFRVSGRTELNGPDLLIQHRLLQPWQFVNHIPRANSICRKDCLARHLQRMNKVYGNIYNYSPQTYNLPLDYTKLVAEYTRILEEGDKATWICKPVGASQGKGITIFSELSTLQYDSNAVVQRYIHNPLLIAGYKFDLRIYACIPSYHPLTVYLYEEGLAR